MKHTKWPWTHAKNQDYTIVDANGSSVCTYHVNEITGDNDLANARLIMAAPEMLDALQGAFDCLDFESHEHIRLAIKNAIAKAKGEL